MANIFEMIAPISMIITAGMLVWVNVMEVKQEREEAKLKEAKEAHEEIKKRWKEAEKE